MKIIVCGAGEVGTNIIKQLYEEGNDLTVIEQRPEVAKKIDSLFDVQTIVGKASSPSILEEAGANKADVIIATTSFDEVNMVVCQLSKHVFDIPIKIARIRQEDFNAAHWRHIFEDVNFPIDMVLRPEHEVAQHIAQAIEIPGAFDYIAASKLKAFRAAIIGVDVEAGAAVIGLNATTYSIAFPHIPLAILAAHNRAGVHFCDNNYKIQAGDKVYIAAPHDALPVVLELFGYTTDQDKKKIVIAGGGTIGLSLALQLEKAGYSDIKVIEKEAARAREIAPLLTRSIVINEDIASRETMLEQQVPQCSHFVAVCDNEHINILSCLQAKKMGTKNSVCLINSQNFHEVTDASSINNVIVPHQITLASLRQALTRKLKTQILKSVFNQRINMAVINIHKNMPVCDKTIKDLYLQRSAFVPLYAYEDKVVFLPKAETVLHGGSNILLVYESHSSDYVNSLFQEEVGYY